VDCRTTREDLSNQPPSFVCWKLFSGIFAFLLLTVGCSSSHVNTPLATLTPQQEEDSQFEIAQLDVAQLECVTICINAITNALERQENTFQTPHIMHTAEESPDIAEESPDIEDDTCHQEEVIGLATCILNEPILIEDPFIEDNCIDCAHSWCDPQYEEIYLSHLDEQRDQKLQTDIFPNFIAPVKNGLVLRGMQHPTKRRRGHYGVDIIPETGQRRRTPLRAVEDGVVVKVARARGYGYYIVLYHQNGLFSLYSHTLKKRLVTPGQLVSRGDTIGYMGKSGNARGYHLHFELIDLRESWNLDDSIDAFVRQIAEGRALSRHECGQFNKLLFAKTSKKDPLRSLSDLRLAKRVNGKWVAAGPVSPNADLAQGK